VQWYLDTKQWNVYLASSGPASWQRITTGETPEQRPLPAVTVSNITTGDDTVEFDVDKVGVPTLVKVSYYPDWTASGADGPYRVAPNLMVVIPTSNHVKLSFGRSKVELGSYFMTLVGMVCLVLLARKRDVVMPPIDPDSGQILGGYLEPTSDPGDDGVSTAGPAWPPGDGSPAWPSAPPDPPPSPPSEP
jgi:hypothetical protein